MGEALIQFICLMIALCGFILAFASMWIAFKVFVAKKRRKSGTDGFWITRKDIVKDVGLINKEDISAVEHPQNPQLPTSIKWKTKTFVLLYASDEGPLMIARIPDELAKQLASNNFNVRRADFPKGNNWYSIPVKGTFEDKESIYKVIAEAQEFVANKAVTKTKITETKE